MMEHLVWFAKTDAPDQSAAVRQLLARALGYMPRLAYGFTPRERAYAVDAARFLKVWTRKEAFVKRDGRGFTLPLNTVETCGRTDIATYMEQGYVISVCGQAADFVLRTVTL